MPLFKNIGQITKYIAISNANTNSSLPKQRGAENEFIIPVLGQELFDTLQTEADSVPDPPSVLLDLTFNALAFLAYYKELPFIHGRITDSGIKNTDSNNQTPVYRYQYENMMTNLENEGLAAIEILLKYLIENKDDYPEWESSSAYERMNNNLIKTGADFNDKYHLYQPHRTFYTIQPVMQEVEDLYIISSIGQTFFEELRDAVTPDVYQSTVLELFRKSVANLTVYKAAAKLSVKLSAEGFTVMLSRNPDRSDQGEENAPTQQLNMLRAEAERDGNNYLNSAIEYLNATASNTIFSTFFNSGYYVNPIKPKVDPNCDFKSGVYIF